MNVRLEALAGLFALIILDPIERRPPRVGRAQLRSRNGKDFNASTAIAGGRRGGERLVLGRWAKLTARQKSATYRGKRLEAGHSLKPSLEIERAIVLRAALRTSQLPESVDQNAGEQIIEVMSKPGSEQPA